MARRHPGLTLVEMMAVIAIIAVILTLALPWIAMAREKARRSTCADNLKRVGLAMHQYEAANGTLPPGHRSVVFGTWQAFVLPYLDQQPPYNAYNFAGRFLLPDGTPDPDGRLRYDGAFNLTATRGRVAVLLCPSDIEEPAGSIFGGISRHNYAANYGPADLFQGLPSVAAFDDPAYKFSWEGAPFGDSEPSNFPSRRTVCRLADITDGLSNTMFAAEVVRGHGADVRGLTWWGEGAGFMAWLGPNSPMPDVQDKPSYCDAIHPNRAGLNPPCSAGDAGHPPTYASRSRHPGGVNVVMGDGAVRFIKDTVRIETWRAVSTTRSCRTEGGMY